MSQNYPAWIDDYAKSMHQAFTNMLPCSWGPIDMVDLSAYLNGALVNKLHEAIVKLKKKNVSTHEVARTFSNLSTCRISFWYLLNDYIVTNPKPEAKAKEVIDYLLEALQSWAKEDTFALYKNIGHNSSEINETTQSITWQNSSPDKAREIGRLYNSVAALSFALYRDFFPQDSHEVYGPYDVSSKYGSNHILTIKHFSKIKPVELWPATQKYKYEDVKIYQIFKDVSFRCEIIGMHSVYEGDLINGLQKFSVEVDGKEVTDEDTLKEIRTHFEQIATEQAQVYDKMSYEDLIKISLDWLCYQYVNLFKLADMDWRPTKEMTQAVKDKKISERHEEESFPPYKEYISSPDYEVYWLKKMYAK